MSILQAAVLGAIQGLTEFVPVSSSGHLALTRWLFGWGLGDPALDQAFDVAVHVGTLLGAALFLRTDLWALAASAHRTVRGTARPGDGLPWLLLASAVPAAVVGATLESTVADRLGGPVPIALMLIVFALVLAWADRLPARRQAGGFGVRDAVVIGVAQAAALQPGVSRSGATISAARASGFDRDSAARLSFLMSLPLIAGAAAYEGLQLLGDGTLRAGVYGPMIVGGGAAALTGAVAVWLVLGLVRTRSFKPFVTYRIAVGVAVLGLAAVR